MRFATAILLPALVLLIVLGAFAVAATLYAGQQLALREASTSAGNENANLNSAVDQAIADRFGTLLTIAGIKAATDLQIAALDPDDKFLKVPLLVGSLNFILGKESTSRFDAISVADADGQQVLRYVDGSRVTGVLESPSLADDSGFLRARASARADAWIEYNSTSRNVTFVQPVVDVRNRFAGVIVGEVAASQLFFFVTQSPTHAASVAILGEGDPWTGSGASAPPSVVTELKREGSDPVVLIRGDRLEAWSAVLLDARLPGGSSRLLVMNHVPISTVTSDISQGILLLAGLFAFTFIAFVAVLALLIERNLRPLRHVVSGVVAAQEGDFNQRIRMEGADEIKGIAAGVNAMAEGLKERESKLIRSLQSQYESDRLAMLGSLAAGVAHEINNPTAFVKGNEQLNLSTIEAVIQHPGVTAETRARLDEVGYAMRKNLDGLDRIQRIVLGLRQFARPPGQPEAVDVNRAALSALDLADPRIKDKLRVHKHLGEELPLAFGRAQEFVQVLLNLMVNAADAFPPQTTGNLWVSTARANDEVVIRVADDGPGVSPQMIPKLFTPFATSKKDGVGIGLAISRKIIDDSGGSISYSSREGGGAVFTMIFPSYEKKASAGTDVTSKGVR